MDPRLLQLIAALQAQQRGRLVDDSTSQLAPAGPPNSGLVYVYSGEQDLNGRRVSAMPARVNGDSQGVPGVRTGALAGMLSNLPALMPRPTTGTPMSGGYSPGGTFGSLTPAFVNMLAQRRAMKQARSNPEFARGLSGSRT